MASRLKRGLLVALLTLPTALVTSCLIEPDEPDCESPRSCDSCIERSGCGWCPGVGCVPGTSLGADDESLTCEDDFHFSECLGIASANPTIVFDPCAQSSTCESCVSDTCRWCAYARGGQCIASGAACGSDRSARSVSRCGDAFLRFDCVDYRDCDGCASDPTCQWEITSSTQVSVFCDAESCRSSGLDTICLPRGVIWE